MFRPVFPDQIAQARRLIEKGFRPAAVPDGELLGKVSKLDNRQHVEVDTWFVMHCMQLPVRGEVA
jgi:hypothetical protein